VGGKMSTDKEECEAVLDAVRESRFRVVMLAEKIIYTHAFDSLNKWQMDIIHKALTYAKEQNANP
jgi:hypothetical protein